MTELLPHAARDQRTSHGDSAASRLGEVEYLLTREVAALLRTSESTVRYWRYIGSGPASVKVGRRVLYRREAVLSWVRDREGANALALRAGKSPRGRERRDR